MTVHGFCHLNGVRWKEAKKEKNLFGGVDEHSKRRKVALERRTKIRKS